MLTMLRDKLDGLVRFWRMTSINLPVYDMERRDIRKKYERQPDIMNQKIAELEAEMEAEMPSMRRSYVTVISYLVFFSAATAIGLGSMAYTLVLKPLGLVPG